MNARWQLFAHKDPYDLTKTSSAFMSATIENVKFHQTHCGPYKVILNSKKFNLESLVNESDLHRIPVLPTLYFKRNHSAPDLSFRSTFMMQCDWLVYAFWQFSSLPFRVLVATDNL